MQVLDIRPRQLVEDMSSVQIPPSAAVPLTILFPDRRTNNKGGPHNVVFDEDDIPDGVDQEAISMDEQLGEEGDTFKMKFDTKGTYGYYCEPHRGAGMTATLVVG